MYQSSQIGRSGPKLLQEAISHVVEIKCADGDETFKLYNRLNVARFRGKYSKRLHIGFSRETRVVTIKNMDETMEQAIMLTVPPAEAYEETAAAIRRAGKYATAEGLHRLAQETADAINAEGGLEASIANSRPWSEIKAELGLVDPPDDPDDDVELAELIVLYHKKKAEMMNKTFGSPAPEPDPPPPPPSRSVQRRVAAQKGEPAPTFEDEPRTGVGDVELQFPTGPIILEEIEILSINIDPTSGEETVAYEAPAKPSKKKSNRYKAAPAEITCVADDLFSSERCREKGKCFGCGNELPPTYHERLFEESSYKAYAVPVCCICVGHKPE